MRGQVNRQIPMFYVMDLEALISGNHPLRAIKRQADDTDATPAIEGANALAGASRRSSDG